MTAQRQVNLIEKCYNASKIADNPDVEIIQHNDFPQP